jgi:hypothetical protein
MPPYCCDRPELELLLRLSEHGVPHGAAGHEMMYGYRLLERCAACGAGLLTTHSHDCFADPWDEPWNLWWWWWRVDPADMPAALQAARACPAPLDPGCGCPVHQGLGEDDPPGLGPARLQPIPPGDFAAIPRAAVRVIDGKPRWSPDP